MESYAKRKTSKRGKKNKKSSDLTGPAVTPVVGRRPDVGVAAKKTEVETRKENDQELLSAFAKDKDEGESSGLGGGEKKARLEKDDENPEKKSGTGNVKCSAGAS